MKKEIADKWVEALRSGNYKQGYGQLKYINSYGETSFCCLGVLCDISNLGYFDSNLDYTAIYSVDNLEYSSSTDLPLPVKEWAGMKSTCGEIDPNNPLYFERDNQGKLTQNIDLDEFDIEDFEEYDSLIDLNDNGASFEQIANIIEKNWKML